MLDEQTHKVWALVVVLQLVHVVRPYTATRTGKLTDPVYKSVAEVYASEKLRSGDYIHSVLTP